MPEALRLTVLAVVCLLSGFAFAQTPQGHQAAQQVHQITGRSDTVSPQISDAEALTVRVGTPETTLTSRFGKPSQTSDVAGQTCVTYDRDPSGTWTFCLIGGRVARAQRNA
jgi:hypothetical protein